MGLVLMPNRHVIDLMYVWPYFPLFNLLWLVVHIDDGLFLYSLVRYVCSMYTFCTKHSLCMYICVLYFVLFIQVPLLKGWGIHGRLDTRSNVYLTCIYYNYVQMSCLPACIVCVTVWLWERDALTYPSRPRIVCCLNLSTSFHLSMSKSIYILVI